MMPLHPQPHPEPRPPAHAPAAPARTPAFDLKGTMAPLTVLRLRSDDLPVVERQLRVKIAQLPQLFLDAPVLLDFGALTDEGAGFPLADLLGVLRSCKLVPVAATNVSDEQRARVIEAGLGILHTLPAARAREGGDSGAGQTPTSGEPGLGPGASAGPGASGSSTAATTTLVPTVTPAHAGPVVVTQPVRSGQVVYAQSNDLVVLAPVNPGAQVIADGHLHVYAPLRGRAVAGAQGLPGARIFCQKLEAELVAVSGAYVMAEEIPADRRGKPAQIFLENGECRITAL